MIDMNGRFVARPEREGEEEDFSSSNLKQIIDENWVQDKYKIKLEFYREFLRGFSLSNNEFVNIYFVEKYLEKNLKRENVNLIINYELQELENAQFATIFEEEADLKNSINNISEKLNLLVTSFNNLSKNKLI